MFDSKSQVNLIAVELINKLGLEVCDHPSPYSLGQVNKDVEIKATKQCRIRFSISVDFIDEVELDVLLLDVCGVVLASHYMYMWDAIFMQKFNQYRLIKDEKHFTINAHKGKQEKIVGKYQPR